MNGTFTVTDGAQVTTHTHTVPAEGWMTTSHLIDLPAAINNSVGAILRGALGLTGHGGIEPGDGVHACLTAARAAVAAAQGPPKQHSAQHRPEHGSADQSSAARRNDCARKKRCTVLTRHSLSPWSIRLSLAMTAPRPRATLSPTPQGWHGGSAGPSSWSTSRHPASAANR